MPKGTRYKPVVSKDQVFGGTAYFERGSKSMDQFKAGPSEGRMRALIGDKGVEKIKTAPQGSSIESDGTISLTADGKKEMSRRTKGKAAVDKAMTEAIDTVRSKKSVNRNDY